MFFALAMLALAVIVFVSALVAVNKGSSFGALVLLLLAIAYLALFAALAPA